ncbi:unnamed protein product [Ambrosiozyma monospora]|uniref:Unnamed protein product n=1 Tax=Ambrosiozyma monospora TaxID=43982 RepID=A0ACB5SV30_AMBMO|nr:unnamed protein product [Ambrosiozyma monospora]
MSLLKYNSTRDLLRSEHRVDAQKSERLQASTCSVDLYEFEGGDNWKIHLNGYTDFLTHGPEMNWHFASSQFEAGSKEDIESRRKQKEEQDKANNRARQGRL